MKYVSCFLLEHAINLDCMNNVKPCCTGENNATNAIFWMRNYNGEDFDVEKYINSRNHYIKLMREGNMPEQCKGCFNLENKDWDDNPKVKYIAIANETKCSCNCVYCHLADDKEYFDTYKSYNVMPVLNALKQYNLLNDTTMDIVGGECTEYQDGQLKEIIDFALNNNCWLHFFSSGIIYSKDIAKALHQSKANLCVSVDSGTKETYEKIKRVKAFDRVWQNLTDYSNSGVKNEITNKGYVILKYIIIPEINDNVEEIQNFLEKAKASGCSWVRFVVEYNWFMKNSNNPIPTHFWKLLDYIEANKKDLKVEYIENAIYLWQKRMEEDKNYSGKNPCI